MKTGMQRIIFAIITVTVMMLAVMINAPVVHVDDTNDAEHPDPAGTWIPKDLSKGIQPCYDSDGRYHPIKNDVPGPGPGTNNGPGAQYSKVELPINSTFLDAYDEYKEDIKELRDIDEGPTSRPAGTPNTLTTPTPPGPTADSNADRGTGFGGIDAATPISDPVTGTIN